jgi:hypothetical protein
MIFPHCLLDVFNEEETLVEFEHPVDAENEAAGRAASFGFGEN